MLTLSSALSQWAKRLPQKIAVRKGESQLTYSSLDRNVSRLTNALKGLGLSRGSVVGVCLEKTPEFVISFLAAARGGYVYAPLNPEDGYVQLGPLIERLNPQALIFDEQYEDIITQALMSGGLENVKKIVVAGKNWASNSTTISWNALMSRASEQYLHVAAPPDEVFYLNFTSGTTGAPKAALTDHTNIYWYARAAIESLALRHEDVHLCAFPSFLHPHETVARAIFLGGTISLAASDGVSLWEAIIRHNVTCLMSAPPVLNMLARELRKGRSAHPSLRLAESGGALTSSSLMGTYQSEFGIEVTPVWGSTETTGLAIIGGSRVSGEISSNGVLGVPADYFEVKVVDEAGLSLGIGEVGELCLAGKAVVRGYYNEPNLTVERFKDGYYLTQDLVQWGSGNVLYFKGRKHDMIKMAGLKVYPAEVEAVLNSHELVTEAVVLGITHHIRGEQVTAVIVKGDNYLLEKEIVSFCRTHLQQHKVPTSIVFRERLPRLASGKVDRIKLRSELEDEVE